MLYMEFHNHGVDNETGDIWSYVIAGKPRKLTPTPRNPNQMRSNYPCVCITDPQFKKTKRGWRSMPLNVHLLVAHTLLEIPIPKGVTEKEWKRTPKSVKKACLEIYQVNHKDHNKSNFRPDNLEFKTSADNTADAMRHYKEITGNSYFNFGDLGEKSHTKNGKNINTNCQPIKNKNILDERGSLKSFFGPVN